MSLLVDESDASNDASIDAQDFFTSGEADSDDDSMAEDLSLSDLYDETLREFDAAVEGDGGWAWEDVDVATRLHQAIKRLRHWKRSIIWLKSGFSPEGVRPQLGHKDEDAVFRGCLDCAQREDPYLSGVIWSYLQDVRDGLENIHNSFQMPAEEATASITTLLEDDLEIALQSLCLQLDPITTLIQSSSVDEQVNASMDCADTGAIAAEEDTKADNRVVSILASPSTQFLKPPMSRSVSRESSSGRDKVSSAVCASPAVNVEAESRASHIALGVATGLPKGKEAAVMSSKTTLDATKSKRRDVETGMLSIEQGSHQTDIDDSRLPLDFVRKLGQGATSLVQEVRDRHTGLTFARKTIRLSNLQQRTASSTFLKEVQALRKLGEHRHFINVYATYATKHTIGILLLPVADQGNLNEYLHKYRRLSKDNGAATALQAEMISVLAKGFGCLANGLAFLHSEQMCHRKIKPHSILVHQDQLMFADFHSGSDFASSTPEKKPTVAVFKYFAPEAVDYATMSSMADVYSLGCVFLDVWYAATESLAYSDTGMYATVMRDIHTTLSEKDVLRTGQALSKWHLIPNILKAMTMLEAKDRPTADDLVRQFSEHLGFSCEECGRETKAHGEKMAISVPIHVPPESLRESVASNPKPSYYTPWAWSQALGKYYRYFIRHDVVEKTELSDKPGDEQGNVR